MSAIHPKDIPSFDVLMTALPDTSLQEKAPDCVAGSGDCEGTQCTTHIIFRCSLSHSVTPFMLRMEASAFIMFLHSFIWVFLFFSSNKGALI